MMPPSAVKLLLLLFCALAGLSEGKSDGKPLSEKDLEGVRMDTKGFDKIKTIHTNWYVHSVKALIAQLSRNILPRLSDDTKKEFMDCLSSIHDKKDLVKSSKCVVRAREQYIAERKWRSRSGNSIKKSEILATTTTTTTTSTTTTTTPSTTTTTTTTTTEVPRKLKKINIKKLAQIRKRLPKELQIPTRASESRSDEKYKSRNPIRPQKKIRKIGTWNDEKVQLLEKKLKVLERARILKDAHKRNELSEEMKSQRMREWKNEKKMELKTQKKADLIAEFKRKWRSQRRRDFRTSETTRKLESTLRREKRSLTRLVVDSVSKSDSHGYFVKTMDRMPNLKTRDSKSPVQRVTNLLRTFFTNQTATDASWADTYRALINMKKKMDQREKESGARVYNERMYDLVLDVPQKEDQGIGYFDKEKMPSLLRNAFDLMSTIEKTSSGKGSNFKFLSPRFAAVMPDKNENRGRLSPSILSFYNDDSEDQILPLPKMLDATGISDKDRDSIIELVMEVSKVKGIVHDAMKMLKSTEMPELDMAIDDNAKKSLQMVQDIQKSYNRKQKKEMKNKGFTLLDPKQMGKLMTEQGIEGRDDIFNLKQYSLLSMWERKELVWDMVRNIAFGGAGVPAPHALSSNDSSIRVKRQGGVWGPHILQPTVLTPLLFTPIYGLNVLGPTVLSPGLFTPLILNPAVLSPYVFSPTVAIPFILSPYVLSPYVFSPLVMAPFILNPYVLAPNVFNPYVLSPLILSPLVICPDVVSPMTLGGAILSPAVLSPSILSKSYIMANVLSPTFLS